MAATKQAIRTRRAPTPPLPYASLQLRIVAFILDLIVLISVFMLFVAIAGFQILARSDWGSQSDIPNRVFWTATYIILSYFVVFLPIYFAGLWRWKGQTVGMMAVHIKVAPRNGKRLSFWRALARTFAYIPSLLPLGLGVLTIFSDRENRALHDRLADTVVLELP
jgi:uncharacterized RDD family membrane protein YckC